MPSSARVALITGCGKPIGIGNSTARALAAAGVTVIVSDVVSTGVANEHNVEGDLDSSWDGVDSLVEELVKSGRTASSTLGDVSVEADAGRMVEEVLGRYGRFDILVNNAGAPQGADRNEIEDVPLEAWDKTMGVNARGAFLMSRAAVPTMRQARWSSVFLRRPPLGQAGTARLMPPPRRQSSASPNRWHSTWRPSVLPSMLSAPVPFALRGRLAPTGANMATISRLAFGSAPRQSRSAASAVPTKSLR